jgi:hypothetical protein
VQYSILDQRPKARMEALAKERNIAILAYGTLLGGFFSERWLGQKEPRNFETVSQQKVGEMRQRCPGGKGPRCDSKADRCAWMLRRGYKRDGADRFWLMSITAQLYMPHPVIRCG